MRMRNSKYDADDMKRYIEDLTAEAKEDQQIVRIEVTNARPNDMYINLEPVGSGDTFPSGATYEIVALGKKDTPIVRVKIKEDHVVATAYYEARIFANGVSTLAE